MRTAGSFNNQMKRLTGSLEDTAVAIGQALLPVVTPMVGWISRAVKVVKDWIQANQGLAVTVAAVAAGIGAAGVALLAIGGTTRLVGAALSVVGAGFGLLASAIGALLSPVGLVVAAVAAGAFAFFRWTEAGQSALGTLGGVFDELLGDATDMIGGIADALKAGDIALAAEILWGTLKVEWLKGVNYLSGVWADWSLAAVDVFRGWSFTASSIMTDMWAGIQTGALKALGFLEDNFGTLIKTLKVGWNEFGGFFAKVFETIKSYFVGGDLQAEIDRINKETEAASLEIASGKGTGGAARQEQIDQVETNRQQSQQAIKDQQQTESDARRQEAAQGLAGGQAELDQAQKDLAAARASAKEKAEKAEKNKGRKPGLRPEDIDFGLANAGKKVEARGSFNAAAVRGLGSGSTIEKMTKSSEQTAKNTAEIAKSVRGGGLATA